MLVSHHNPGRPSQLSAAQQQPSSSHAAGYTAPNGCTGVGNGPLALLHCPSCSISTRICVCPAGYLLIVDPGSSSLTA